MRFPFILDRRARLVRILLLAPFLLASCGEDASDGSLWASRRPVWGSGLGGSNVGNGISDTPTEGLSPCVAVDSSGRPTVVWREQGAYPSIYVRRWDGSVWAELGGSASGTGISGNGMASRLDLAVDGAGNPVLVYEFDNAIFLKRWNGSTWEEVGGSATGDGIGASPTLNSQMPALAVDSGDRPLVAWTEEVLGSGWAIYLRRWDGSSWSEIGGSATGGGISGAAPLAECSRIALDSGGHPVVSWLGSNGVVRLRRWTGTAWGELGGSGTAGIVQTEVQPQTPELLLMPDDSPVVAYLTWAAGETGRIAAKKWTGSAWEEMTDPGSGAGPFPLERYSQTLSMCLDTAGRPVIAAALQLQSTSSQVFLRRWSGSSWEDVAGAGGAGGITEHLGGGIDPALACGGGLPFVAVWMSTLREPTRWEIFLARSPE
jgi:hypothetical protein